MVQFIATDPINNGLFPPISTIFNRLLPTLPEGKTINIYVGPHWTAVLVQVKNETLCGLAATLDNGNRHDTPNPARPSLDDLRERSPLELARLANSPNSTETSIGLAAINALNPHHPDRWVDLHSKEVLARLGSEKTVVMVGHFPYVPELRPRVGRLLVLEQEPQDDDLPAEQASAIIPQADVLAITASTLVNHTFDEVMQFRRPGIPTLLMGPTTPLSPLLFETGLTILSGAVVEQPHTLIDKLMQGANFHQLRQLGVRLVSIVSEPLPAV